MVHMQCKKENFPGSEKLFWMHATREQIPRKKGCQQGSTFQHAVMCTHEVLVNQCYMKMLFLSFSFFAMDLLPSANEAKALMSLAMYCLTTSLLDCNNLRTLL